MRYINKIATADTKSKNDYRWKTLYETMIVYKDMVQTSIDEKDLGYTDIIRHKTAIGVAKQVSAAMDKIANM